MSNSKKYGKRHHPSKKNVFRKKVENTSQQDTSNKKEEKAENTSQQDTSNKKEEKVENKSQQDTSKKVEEEGTPAQVINIEDKRVHINDTPKWYRNPMISLLVSIFSVGISILGLYHSCKQSHTQDSQYQLQLNEDQPIFTVDYELEKVENDKIFDTEYLHVKNVGKVVKSIESQSLTILNIQLFKQNIENEDSVRFELKYFYRCEDEEIDSLINSMFPRDTILDIDLRIDDYYPRKLETKSLIGDICYVAYPVNYMGLRKIWEYRPIHNDSIKIVYNLDKFVKIEYLDIHDKYHSIYYKNGTPSSSEEFYERDNNVLDDCVLRQMRSDDIKAILEYCGFKN